MKQIKSIVLILIFSIFVLVGCSDSEKETTNSNQTDEKSMEEYQQQVKDLKVENGRLKIEKSKLEKKIEVLEKEVSKTKQS